MLAGWLTGEAARARVLRRRPALPTPDRPPGALRSRGGMRPAEIAREVDRGMLALRRYLREGNGRG
jgi:hypothetical protein